MQVINARGAISVTGEHAATQRRLLEREGVAFEPSMSDDPFSTSDQMFLVFIM